MALNGGFNGINSIKRSALNGRNNFRSVSTLDDVPSTATSFLHDSEDDNDYNHAQMNSNQNNSNDNPNLLWPHGKNRLPMILFSSKAVFKVCSNCKKIGEQFKLTYKFQGGEKKLVKAVLDGHGFKEVHPHSSDFNIMWTGNNIKTYMFRSLKEHQKINHFPRSCELTRKDRLYKNVQRMQQERGIKSYQIIPTTFVMPYEIDDFYSTFYREKGFWIVKPVASSRGRGIFLINHPDQVPLDDNLVVSKYVSNPLLIEGYKFDLRLYVAVTSFDPLVIYMYEEGLTRFATIKYDKNLKNLKNTWIHLTNYSVNKKNDKYVRCNDPNVDDYGNKWSLSAMLRYLAREGKDTFTLMMQIEELIIKTILAVESPLASASRMFIPHRGNCFEVYGFDILIDEELKPWVLEVNLSPSLDCDAALDLKIKSNMIADLLTLTGVYCQTQTSSRSRFFNRNDSASTNRSRPQSAAGNQSRQSAPNSRLASASVARNGDTLKFEGLSQNESSIFKNIQEENNRCGNWIRIFPTADSWEFFSQYLETRTTSYNLMLHQKLFPKRWTHGTAKKTSVSRAKLLQASYSIYKQTSNQNILNSDTGVCVEEAIRRHKLYLRKLSDAHDIDSTTYGLALQRFIPPNLLYQQPQGAKSHSTIHIHDTSDADTDAGVTATVLTSKPPLKTGGFVTTNLPQNSSRSNGSSSHTSKTILNGSAKKPLPVTSSTPTVSPSTHRSENMDYSFEAVLKLLDDGYYMNRIQVRYAFALYLSKIQNRLMIESEIRDESNTQQMDLVLRFMKKAAVNLSQSFKVYLPSKRLPINEQKRMLSKQLQDFLQIYQKDTEQIKVEQSTELEIEKLKNHKRLFNESSLMSLLNRSTEMQLEEIMSVYMRNSKDSSAFLGRTVKKDENLRKLKMVLKTNAKEFERTLERHSHRTRSFSIESGTSSPVASRSSSNFSNIEDVRSSISSNSVDDREDLDSPPPKQELKKEEFQSKPDRFHEDQLKSRLHSAQSVNTNSTVTSSQPSSSIRTSTARREAAYNHFSKRPLRTKPKSATLIRSLLPRTTPLPRPPPPDTPPLNTKKTLNASRRVSSAMYNMPSSSSKPVPSSSTSSDKQTNSSSLRHTATKPTGNSNADSSVWSIRLKSFVEKQQKRQYSPSAKLVLQQQQQQTTNDEIKKRLTIEHQKRLVRPQPQLVQPTGYNQTTHEYDYDETDD